MKKFLLAIVVFPCLCSAQYTYKNLEVNFLDKANEASVYTFGNLRIYPVRAKENFRKEFASVGKYMTLNEAIVKSLDVIPLLCEGKFEAAMMQLHTTK